jgi:phosphoribosylformylglycinamidine synthase
MPAGVLDEKRVDLQRAWSATSFHLQQLRDNPACADEELARIDDLADPGLNAHVEFDPSDDIAAPFIASGVRPRIAILREQGVNGQVEMAAAFDRAGFDAVDVHMSDILAGRTSLVGFRASSPAAVSPTATCSVPVRAGRRSILFNERARVTSSRRSSRAVTRSPSASATAAR